MSSNSMYNSQKTWQILLLPRKRLHVAKRLIKNAKLKLLIDRVAKNSEILNEQVNVLFV